MKLEDTLSMDQFSASIQKMIYFIDEHTDVKSLTALYNQREHGYHNINHINELLLTLNSYQNNIADNDSYKLDDYDLFALVMVIVFHDAVYAPGANDNEHKSAQLAQKELNKAWVDKLQTQVVADIIEDTAEHTPVVGDYEQGERRHYLGQLMFDLDFSPLAKNYNEFRNDGVRICNEYATQIDVVDFYKGRVQFLRSMLEQERIFNLDYFYNHYEQAARDNIQKELEALKTAIS